MGISIKLILFVSIAFGLFFLVKLISDMTKLRSISIIDRESGQIILDQRSFMLRLQSVLVYQWGLLGKRNKVIHAIYKIYNNQAKIKMNKPFSSDQKKRVQQVKTYAKKLGVQLDTPYPYIKQLHQFESPNDFFIREIDKKFRPVDSQPNSIIASADSSTVVYKKLEEAKHLWIKGEKFTLAGTSVPEPYLSALKDPSVIVHRLSPNDYHRFWYPVSGDIVYFKEIHDYPSHSVQNFVVNNPKFNIFNTNKRTLTVIRHPSLGYVLFMAVGAISIDSIMSHHAQGAVEKGQEAGYFQFGGSSLVIFFESDKVIFDQDLIEHSKNQLEMWVKIGSKMGQIKAN